MKPEIILIAAVSRLFDLHQSRHERGIPVASIPDPSISSPDAGYYLSAGLAVIKTLQKLEMEEGAGYKPKSRVIEEVKTQYPFIHDADIDYSIRFLSIGREIHYLSETDLSEEKDVFTRETTPLIERAGEFNQVRLTVNARHFLKIGASKRFWLYEDKDVEKILSAIEKGFFDDVPGFCLGVVESLAMLGQKIAQAEESPTMDKMRKEFVQFYPLYKETLSNSLNTIRKAITATGTEHIMRQFEEWTQEQGIENITLGNLLSDLEIIAQLIEKIERKLLRFLIKMNEGIKPSIGGIRFQDIAKHLVIDPPPIEILASYLLQSGPCFIEQSCFHPFDFIETVDFSSYISEINLVSKTVDLEATNTINPRFRNFLEKNIELIIKRIEKGPLLFSEIINEFGFVLEEGDTFADFFGIYALPGEIAFTKWLLVGTDGGLLRHRHDSKLFHGTDPSLILIEEVVNDAQ